MASTSHGIQVVDRERVAEQSPPDGRSDSGPPARAATVGTGTVPAMGIGTLGVLILLTGAWGGIVPFVGPLFGYSGDGAVSWQWNLMHALLWLAPGAVACAMALTMLGMVPRAVRGLAGAGAFTTGMVTVLCGAWFVVGPAAWPVFERSGGVFVPAGPLHSLLHLVGYSFGPGILLVLFGALAMGMAGRRRRVLAVAEQRTPAVRRHVWHRPVTA